MPLKHPVSILRVKRWYDRELELSDISGGETEIEKEENSSVPDITNLDEELPIRLEDERLVEDVHQSKETSDIKPNLNLTQKKKKRKDWSFIDTDEFKRAPNQNVEFIGRTPRSAKVSYAKEHILWLDYS